MPFLQSEKAASVPVAPRAIAARIHLIRGQRVLLASDLADLYGVLTKAINQAVARNPTRFPPDFAFQLTTAEVAHLRSQSVTSSEHGGSRYAPRAFTEQGVAMLSSVLRSRRAIDVNVAIMRAFVHVRELLASHAGLARRIDAMEQRYDGQFADVFAAIRELTSPAVPAVARPRIGFTVDPQQHDQSTTTARPRPDRRVRRR
jgi:hypothetical protein